MDCIDITANENENLEVAGGSSSGSSGGGYGDVSVAPTRTCVDMDDRMILHEFKNESLNEKKMSAEMSHLLLYWKRFDQKQIRSCFGSCVSEFIKYHEFYGKLRDKRNDLRQILLSKLEKFYKFRNSKNTVDELVDDINKIFENELNNYENEITLRKDLIETKLGFIEEKLFSLKNPSEFMENLLLSYDRLKYELTRYRTLNMDLRKVIDKQNKANLLKVNKENEEKREKKVDYSGQNENEIAYDTSKVKSTIRLDTVKIVQNLKQLLRKHAIAYRLFTKAVLGLSTSILSKPRPWKKLGLKAKRHFIKMHLFLNDRNNIAKLRKWIDADSDPGSEFYKTHYKHKCLAQKPFK